MSDNPKVPADVKSAEPSYQGECTPCRSTWKPSRRAIIGAAGAVAVGALIAASPAASFAAPPEVKASGFIPIGETPTEPPIGIGGTCAEAYEQCIHASEVERELCGERAQDYDDISLCITLDIIRRELCFDAFQICIALPVIDKIAQALEEAAVMIAIGIAVIGAVVLIGGILVIFVECIIVTGGICAAVVLA